jgi:hypothetical protein
VIIPPPQTDIDVNSITFADASVLTSVADLTPDRLVNGSKEVVLNADGTLALPTSSNGLYTTTNALIKSFADIQISAGDDAGSNWIFGGNGNLLLPSGGTITEGTVTSNPTIQLTPDNPTVASQKLVIKGGGSYQTDDNGISLNLSNITFQVGDAVDAYIYAPANANQILYWWIVPEGAGIADPDSGNITLDNDGYGTVTFELDSDDYEFRIRISPEEDNYDPDNIGVESLLINGDAPTFGGDHHLHLTTGDLTETSIILGTDDQNVRTTPDGGIQITTTISGIPTSVTKTTNNQGWGNDQIGPAFATTGGTGSGLTVDVNNGGGSGYAIISINTPGTGYTVGDVITVTSDDNSVSDNFTIDTVTNGAASTWQFSRDGSLTFPDATVQRSAYQTGQQTILVDEGSASGAEIDITALTSSLILIRSADGYNTVEDTHYINLPFGTAEDVDIPLGTKITIINRYDGTVAINGWGFPPRYDMSINQNIDLVYINDGNPFGINIWWVTNSFLWD